MTCKHGFLETTCAVCMLEKQLDSKPQLPTKEMADALDKATEESARYYAVDCICDNCGVIATIQIPMGEPVASTICYNCGCKMLRRRYV